VAVDQTLLLLEKYLFYVPMRGPRLYIAMADALSRSENKSPTDPPPIATGAPPDKPAAYMC
jgi:hypothetical protein